MDPVAGVSNDTEITLTVSTVFIEPFRGFNNRFPEV